MDNKFPQPIAKQIWERKYRLITPNKDIANDETVSDTWQRIAKACAYSPHSMNLEVWNDANRGYQEQVDLAEYRKILTDFNFLPGGRIIAGAGSGRNVTMFNCYVMGTIPDNMEGIFQSLKEAALTQQQGGGIGYDFSTLRPSGSPVKGVDADASGPLSFMDVWDSMCRTILSAGYRRGAMMATMRCDHPDIEAFIKAKRDTNRLRMFNLSVLCSNEFMRAVKGDHEWNLIHEKPPANNLCDQRLDGHFVHKTMKARELWDLIMESSYNYAEPGVLFIDEINNQNNLHYMEEIKATNPCGEQPLPPYGACLLGSVNLTKMVKDPFTNPSIDWAKITKTATIAVRMLDVVIDISNFPLPEQKAEALLKRRMGIGITGLGSMLFMMNATYGSHRAADLANQIMHTITMACYRSSIELAKMYGPCPATYTMAHRQEFIQSGFMVRMPSDIQQDILTHGIRNALLTSIAPTGTISMFAGNVSSGIEPIFAAEYSRKILDDDAKTTKTEVVQDYAVHLFSAMTDDSRQKHMEHLVTAQTLTPADHLIMQATVQPWVDSSISKTINCPEDIEFEDFKAIYMEAYDQGCKGCTTYRPNPVTGSVLSVESDEEPSAPVDAQEASTLLLHHPITEPMERPENLTGTTYKLKWGGKSYYVTMNDYVDANEKTIPFEIFINSSSMESLQWTVALTRMISAVYRRGGQVEFIGEELKRISDPAGGQWVNKKFVPSFVALLGQCIMNHMITLDRLNELDLGYEGVQAFDGHETNQRVHNKAIITTNWPGEIVGSEPEQCPECSDYAMVMTDGCATCTSCGYSKCG